MTPSRLRIAFVIHDYGRHVGQGRYVAELATRFRHQHEVHVFANTFDEPDSHGMTFHHVPAWRRAALTTILSFLVPATFMVSGFDIVHAQGLCGLRHNVATAHICSSAWLAGLRKHGQQPTRPQRLFGGLIQRLEQYALCKASTRRVIAVSQRIAHDLGSHYGRTSGVTVIRHAVDTERFHPRNRAEAQSLRAEWGVTPADFVALYVGDLKKGATASIKAVVRCPKLNLVLVSSSNPELYRAACAGAENRIHFLPATKQIERCYAAADAFLFPTPYDSFGMALTEAMATGLPVVTNREAGAAELIQDGKNGLLTNEPWNVTDLASLLTRLQSDRAMGERLGEAARKTVEPLTWDRVAEATLKVYGDVTAQKSKRG